MTQPPKKKEVKDLIQSRHYKPEDHIWGRGYNSAIDDYEKWIDVCPIEEVIHNHVVDMGFSGNAEKVFATAIREMLKNGATNEKGGVMAVKIPKKRDLHKVKDNRDYLQYDKGFNHALMIIRDDNPNIEFEETED